MQQMLLLSSSKYQQTQYLEHALPTIKEFSAQSFDEATFIPFAGITVSYDDYEAMVQKALAPIGIKVTSIHRAKNAFEAIQKSKSIIVGGGNTFHLLHQLYQFDLIGAIRDAVNVGRPYIGWSAGSNVAGMSIKTTNDMPIIQPPSFNAMQLLPFQINPHYFEKHPVGFNGETREQRLQEYMVLNPNSPIIGLPEGTGIKINQRNISFFGEDDIYYFKGGSKQVLDKSNNHNSLLNQE